jgi:xanthine dehydrogenase accessory factor
MVVSAHGSVPGRPGATMLVTVDGTSRGTVGGAGLEERVKALCVEALQKGHGGVHVFDLANWKMDRPVTDPHRGDPTKRPVGRAALDSVCGGTVEVAISIVKPVPHILLVGGGHCARSLAKICDVLGWGYTVVDSRPAFVEGFPNARSTHAQLPAEHVRSAKELPFSHAYLMGHSHHEDGDAVIALVERDFRGVIGVIGSRSKLHAFKERAAKQGLSLDNVRTPIGLDVGAQTPAEIAVAVAAEIIRDIKLGPSARADPTSSKIRTETP